MLSKKVGNRRKNASFLHPATNPQHLFEMKEPLLYCQRIAVVKIALLLLFLFILSCQRESAPTIIKGKIINKTTGAPVERAYVECSIHKGGDTPSQSKDISVYSDMDGSYLLEIPDGYSFSFSAIYYISKYLTYVVPARSIEIQKGEINEVNISLIPKDGFIRLKYYNDILQNDSLYVNFFSPIQLAQPSLGGLLIPPNLPFILPFNTGNEQIFAFPSEEFITINWGTTPFQSNNSSYHDSIYLKRNEILDFDIHF